MTAPVSRGTLPRAGLIQREVRRDPTLVAAALTLAAAASLAGVWAMPSALPAVVILWVVGLLTRRTEDRAAFMAPFVLAWLLVGEGLYAGASFPFQVAPYVGVHAPLDLILDGNVWGPRYLASYPAAWVTLNWEIDLQVAWRYYMLIVLCLQGLVVQQLWIEVQHPRRPSPAERLLFGLGAVLLFILIGTLMNGRLAPAHLGMALILLGIARARRRGGMRATEGVLIAIGLFPLSLTTTGTIIPAAATALLALGAELVRRGVGRGRTVLIILVALLPTVPFVYAGVIKNLTFYAVTEGSAWRVIDHGAGVLLTQNQLLTATLLVWAIFGLVVLVAVGRRVRKRTPNVVVLLALLPIAAAAGLFGYSTGSMAVPAVVVLGMLVLRPGLRVLLQTGEAVRPEALALSVRQRSIRS